MTHLLTFDYEFGSVIKHCYDLLFIVPAAINLCEFSNSIYSMAQITNIFQCFPLHWIVHRIDDFCYGFRTLFICFIIEIILFENNDWTLCVLGHRIWQSLLENRINLFTNSNCVNMGISSMCIIWNCIFWNVIFINVLFHF